MAADARKIIIFSLFPRKILFYQAAGLLTRDDYAPRLPVESNSGFGVNYVPYSAGQRSGFNRIPYYALRGTD
jgi:hypothetical protein